MADRLCHPVNSETSCLLNDFNAIDDGNAIYISATFVNRSVIFVIIYRLAIDYLSPLAYVNRPIKYVATESGKCKFFFRFSRTMFQNNRFKFESK